MNLDLRIKINKVLNNAEADRQKAIRELVREREAIKNIKSMESRVNHINLILEHNANDLSTKKRKDMSKVELLGRDLLFYELTLEEREKAFLKEEDKRKLYKLVSDIEILTELINKTEDELIEELEKEF